MADRLRGPPALYQVQMSLRRSAGAPSLQRTRMKRRRSQALQSATSRKHIRTLSLSAPATMEMVQRR